MYRFVNGVPQPNFPYQISRIYQGIPNNIDAAFRWSGNNKIYFMKGNLFSLCFSLLLKNLKIHWTRYYYKTLSKLFGFYDYFSLSQMFILFNSKLVVLGMQRCKIARIHLNNNLNTLTKNLKYLNNAVTSIWKKHYLF